MRTLGAPVVIAITGAIAAAAIASFILFSSPPPAQVETAGDAESESSMTLSTSPKNVEVDKPSAAPQPTPSVAEVSPPDRESTKPQVELAAPSTAPTLPGKAPYKPGPSKFKQATDPTARTLLARVGADFDAEVYWLNAINDPRTPAKERQDLIEDLNEDGISDPSKPTRQDLPLITSRIELIERLLPSAKDPVNAAAFREAHKDLVKMRDRLEQ